MLRNTKGFTLIELMIVVVIIGILAAIAIPNFISMQDRARESSVKANMHTAQLAMEDFAVQSDGIYSTAEADATPGGETVAELCPGDQWPDNPFSSPKAASAPTWGAAPADEGEFGFETATVTSYNIQGCGKDGNLLTLELTNGL
jgi:prepilin-type N-terminal cleavage/methylation domain-containing protein